ncbi:Uncharacterized protein GBIM_13312 [Gryllus bimaculatus]|nr:Uncharacterized protein GBIM_13312 [Gryllus bimaculatus]
MVRVKIDLNLLPMKAQFFLWNAGTAPVVPFLPTYARQLGFSSVIVGTVYTILPITGMLAKPLFGALADRYQCQKLLFIVFQVVTAITFFGIQFIPEIPLETPLQLSCDKGFLWLKSCVNRTLDDCSKSGVLNCQVDCKNVHWNNADLHYDELSMLTNISLNHTLFFASCNFFKMSDTTILPHNDYVPYCTNHSSSLCSMDCKNPAIRDVTTEPVPDSQVPSLYQFWLFVLLMILSWVGMAVVVSIGDAICFGMLGDKHSRYGHQRLWGAVGWGVFSVISGLLVDEFSQGKSQKDYTAVFFLMAIMLFLDVLVSTRLKYSQTKLSASIFRDVGRIVGEPRIVVFIIWIITVGLCTGLVWQFLFWHLEDLAKNYGCGTSDWIKTLEGLVMGIQCFGGELPFFFLSGRILKKIGHIHTMTLVLLGIALRFILYSQLTNPWWCLPIELFQGITFGIFYATMASFASIVAPPGTEATVQGLVGALFEGVGVSLGSLLGGVLFDSYGGHTTFLVYGLGSLVMFVLHIIVQYYLSSKNSNISKEFDSPAHYTAPHEAIQILENDEPTMGS